MRPSAAAYAVLAILAGVLALGGSSCRRGSEGKARAYPFVRVYERGPVSFRVSLSDSAVTIADRVTMLLEARAGEGYQAELPQFGDKLSQFGIVNYQNPPPALGADGIVTTTRLYELEPFLSGEYRIPPMAVTFWQAGDTTRHSIESDTITVLVKSLLAEGDSLVPRDIARPAPYPSSPWKALAIAGGVVAAGAAAYLLLRRRRVRALLAPRVPAHEAAYRKLEELLAAGLLDRKLYREFTAAVSDILRWYIEERFGLRAPERTTEEFLAEAGVALPVDAARKEIVKQFLIHCDLVKFAALEPSLEDVKRTFDTCKDFIEATKEREEVRETAA